LVLPRCCSSLFLAIVRGPSPGSKTRERER
jgi:hypothetical protein